MPRNTTNNTVVLTKAEIKRRKRQAVQELARRLAGGEKLDVSKHPEKTAKKVVKVLLNRDTSLSAYLRCLVDPFAEESAKIPDFITYPSTTFFLRQRWLASTEAGGGFAALIYPWSNGTVLSKAAAFGGTGTNEYNWPGMTWTTFSKNPTIQSAFAMARPVAMGVRVSYVGPITSAQGNFVAALIDSKTTLPNTYEEVLTLPEYQEFSVTSEAASFEATWKPLSTAAISEYIPVDQYIVPQGLAQIYFPTGAAANTAFAVPASLVYKSGLNIARMGNSNIPGMIIAAKGFLGSTPSLKIEIIAHFEATVQSQTLHMGENPVHTDSPFNPQELHMAHSIVAQVPVAHSTQEHNSFIERIAHASQQFGKIVEHGVGTATRVAPVIAKLLASSV